MSNEHLILELEDILNIQKKQREHPKQQIKWPLKSV